MSQTQTLTTSKQQNYRIHNKENKPVNLIPTNLIKCTHCNMYIPIDEFQAHVQMHIPVQMRVKEGMSRSGSKQTIGKVCLKEVIWGEQEEQEICVRSMLPEEMPQAEQNRKQFKYFSNTQQNKKLLSTPKSPQILPKSLSRASTPESSSLDPHSLSSSFNQTFLPSSLDSAPNDQSQKVEHLHFKKVLTLKQHQVNIKKSQIKYYTNNRQLKHFNDEVHIPQKMGINDDGNGGEVGKENRDGYIFVPVKKQKMKQVGYEPIRVEIRGSVKMPEYKEKLSTVSTTGSGFRRANQNNDNDSSQQTSSNIDNRNRQLQCTECHGFYCKACGSDIPPIFRPNSPNHKINNLPINLQSSRQFYLSHVYRNKDAITNQSNIGKTSRMTGCTNCS